MTMYEFHEVSAFTHEGIQAIGNPAAICLVKEFPDESFMSKAARKLGSPMTSFIRYTNDPNIFDIRHFSPKDGEENHVCGHATLAAAELLAQKHPELRNNKELSFRLNPKYAINSNNCFKASINGQDIALKIPAIMELERVDDPDFYIQLCDALGIKQNDIEKPCYYAPRIINYVVAFKDQGKFLAMSPNFDKLKQLASSDKFPHEGIMATVKSEIPGHDILTRVFLPIIGVDEDIACGSANCSVVPYWTQMRQGTFPVRKTEFKALFPYPSEIQNNKVGGIQNLHLDLQRKEITLTGQATFQRTISLDLELNSSPSPRPS